MAACLSLHTVSLLRCCSVKQSDDIVRNRPQIRRDYPLNLSISISGGKETKTNSPSSGERNEKSPYTEVGEQCCSSTVWC
ncbi:hypothetical protein T10_2082 [Trichinella papuae]|uniref:Uncharacterized protein n=1 Tax=Trichinella papuae TaxID=268474 RepID=A0A0V1M2Z0_9BILA|nr:hypothetical protein T10_2082 [Trichinella papuae]